MKYKNSALITSLFALLLFYLFLSFSYSSSIKPSYIHIFKLTLSPTIDSRESHSKKNVQSLFVQKGVNFYISTVKNYFTTIAFVYPEEQLPFELRTLFSDKIQDHRKAQYSEEIKRSKKVRVIRKFKQPTFSLIITIIATLLLLSTLLLKKKKLPSPLT
ncbi:hypothetical protein BIY24_01840 [Halobacteriovorax marinus]|nr:hypothetical protein BIY24_01840 [Halobacteriovorax marinus]